MLEEAISEYQGTVITISHDRYFIRQTRSGVLILLSYYVEKNLEAREKELEREAELEEKAPKPKAKSKMSKEEREARKAKSKGLKNAKRWK
ncbi:hypothetical protein OPV22_011794 [Ensete ventricosum]|uniref:ABC-transporter extension domain-containing protein n=1 Tax=Ensete ventricosum TaxID=4639 RepID=A0AAV8RNZ6_ENSVE|nr:hypothetical protein OPV22_011794 [Ensete ventricosum]